MTTVCLKSKTPVKTEAWSSVFNSVNTDTESCLFIKQLTNTCVSTILHLRKILSDEFFEAKSFEGVTLQLLKPRGPDGHAFKIQQWLEGAFDAIEKKYLKRLMLDIQDAESNRILEVYTITFNYCSEKETLNCLLSTSNNSRISNTKSNTIKLLQMCYAVTQTYRSLPPKVTLGMRLSYYESTPEDYQPRGYMAWESEEPEFKEKARSIELGVTGTPHHFFKLCNKSCLSDRFFKKMEDHLENSGSSLEQEEAGSHQKEKISPNIKTKASEPCPELHDTDKLLKKQLPTSTDPQPGFLMSEKNPSKATKKAQLQKNLKSLKVRCSCLFSKQSDSMFSCSSCGFLVHSDCFGILEFDPSKKIRFYCHQCHQKENNTCPDKVLVGLNSSSDQQKLSLLRRVLGHCHKSHIKAITLKKMEKLVGADCQRNIMSVVLNKMVQMGVAVPQGKKKSYIIDRNRLANHLVKYFYKVQDSVQTKQQISPYTLRSLNCLKRKPEADDISQNKKNKTFPTVLQEIHSHNNDTDSQQSHDIFSCWN